MLLLWCSDGVLIRMVRLSCCCCGVVGFCSILWGQSFFKIFFFFCFFVCLSYGLSMLWLSGNSAIFSWDSSTLNTISNLFLLFVKHTHPHMPYPPIAIVDYSHVDHIVYYINHHILYISCCYCRLYPCPPHCVLHKSPHTLPYPVAVVDYTHVHHIVYYTNHHMLYHILLLL